MQNTGTKKGYKKWLIALLVILLAGASVIWWIFTSKFEDTKKVKADHIVNAIDFIKEFGQDEKAANAKYSEKIVIVNGTVSAIRYADTTANVIMTDLSNGNYIIFAFQQQHLHEARQMKAGDQVSIKGSCSGGNYSEILGVESINFKRCTVNR